MPGTKGKYLTFFAAALFMLACLPGAMAADNAFEITHSRFQPRFGEAAQIRYTLAENAFTSVTVYNLRGERVALLFSGFTNAGSYQLSWGGQNAAGALVASGAYVIQVISGAFTQTRKVVVVK
jgi:hypothetical protein